MVRCCHASATDSSSTGREDSVELYIEKQWEEGVVGAPEGRRELWVHQRGGGAGMKMVLVHDTLIINR